MGFSDKGKCMLTWTVILCLPKWGKIQTFILLYPENSLSTLGNILGGQKHFLVCGNIFSVCRNIFSVYGIFFSAQKHVFSAQNPFLVFQKDYSVRGNSFWCKEIFIECAETFLPPSIFGLPLCRDYVNDGSKPCQLNASHPQ